MSTTSVSLIRRLTTSSSTTEESWQRFVKLYTPLLFYWARKVGLRSEEAEDLVQDILIVLMEKLPAFDYDANGSFRGWLRMITLNRCRDHLRRKRLGPRDGYSSQLRQIEAGDEIEVLTEREYQDHVIAQALKLMQEEFQPTTWKACWLHVLERKSAAEISAELNITVNAVYLAKSRVMRKLRQELDGLLG